MWKPVAALLGFDKYTLYLCKFLLDRAIDFGDASLDRLRAYRILLAELPVIDTATNLVIEISELPISPVMMTSFESDTMFPTQKFAHTVSRQPL